MPRPSAALLCALCMIQLGLGQRARAETAGWTLSADLEHAAYTHAGVADVVLHAPPHFDPTSPLQLVVFLHGFSGCAPVLMGEGKVPCRADGRALQGWALSRHHDAAGTNTLFVIPQLALLERNGNPGCFGRSGCFRRFLKELLRGPLADKLGAARSLSEVAGITLVAHSAGFETTLAILQRGEVDDLVRHVVLLDALYAGTEGFARWLQQTRVPDAKLISVHLGRGKTQRNSERLYRTLRKRLGADAVAAAGAGELATRAHERRLIVARGRGPHGSVPARHLAELLRALWPPGASR